MLARFPRMSQAGFVPLSFLFDDPTRPQVAPPRDYSESYALAGKRHGDALADSHAGAGDQRRLAADA